MTNTCVCMYHSSFKHEHFDEALEDDGVFPTLAKRNLIRSSNALNMMIPYDGIPKLASMCLPYAKFRRASIDQVHVQVHSNVVQMYNVMHHTVTAP